jgi:hypothetical protein
MVTRILPPLFRAKAAAEGLGGNRAFLDQSSRTVLFLNPPGVVPFERIRKSMLSPNP